MFVGERADSIVFCKCYRGDVPRLIRQDQLVSGIDVVVTFELVAPPTALTSHVDTVSHTVSVSIPENVQAPTVDVSETPMSQFCFASIALTVAVFAQVWCKGVEGSAVVELLG